MSMSIIARGVVSQLLAGLYTLRDCIERCPEEDWNESHDDYPFSQVVFHTLFDCDYHLCDNDDQFKVQEFHRRNVNIFSNYAGLEDFVPLHLYERDFIRQYYEHCRLKAISTIEGKTVDQLAVPNSDVRRNMTKLERYVNIIRHIQHHTAQLALRLQVVTGMETEWISRGYETE